MDNDEKDVKHEYEGSSYAESEETEHFITYLSPESTEQLRRILGKRVSKFYTLSTRSDDAISLSDKLFIELVGNGGYVVLDAHPEETDLGYYHYMRLSAGFAARREDIEAIATKAQSPHVQGPLTGISVEISSPVNKISIYEGHNSDPDFSESVSFDQVIVIHHEDGKWFAVSGRPGENCGLELVQDEDRLREILKGDYYYAPCQHRLTLE
jgi:hypothetical protein